MRENRALESRTSYAEKESGGGSRYKGAWFRSMVAIVHHGRSQALCGPPMIVLQQAAPAALCKRRRKAMQ